MGHGTNDLRRRTKKALEAIGLKVRSIESSGSTHLRYTVEEPDGRQVDVYGPASPTNHHTAPKQVVKNYQRFASKKARG